MQESDSSFLQKLNEMKYLRNVLDESLRLYPPVPIDGRRAIEDDILPSGHHIPANTFVLYSSLLMHRRKDLWGEDAEEFKPERFQTALSHPYMFVPFHAGPQVCLGQNMAYREAKVLTCMLLRRFRFELVKDQVVVPRKSIVMPARDGVRMLISPRENAPQ